MAPDQEMNQDKLPEATARRLPLYLRCLLELESSGMPVVSSERLADMAGTNAAQVRKDLSMLGEFGVRGMGYDVPALSAQLSRHLGLDVGRRIAIVGYGRIGAALQGYPGFEARGLHIAAVFDSDPAKIGEKAGRLTVRDVADLEAVIAREHIDIVLIATPAEAAPKVAQRAAAAGVKAFLNMAPALLGLPADVAVRHIDLAIEMEVLSFRLAEAGVPSTPAPVAETVPAAAAVAVPGWSAEGESLTPELAGEPGAEHEGGKRPDEPVPLWLAITVLVLILGVVALGGWMLKGVLSRDKGETGSTRIEISQLEERLAKDPRDMKAMLDLAFAYQQAGRYQDALSRYDKVLATDPRNTGALYNKGVIYRELDLFDKAEDTLWEVLEIEPAHPLAAAALGEMYAEKGHYKSVVVAVRPAAEANPRSADLQYLLGLAYEKTGHRDWAAARYRMALEYMPDSKEAQEGLERVIGK